MGAFDGLIIPSVLPINGGSVGVGVEENRGAVAEARYFGPVAYGAPLFGYVAPTATVSVSTDGFEAFSNPRGSVGVGMMLTAPTVFLHLPMINGSLELDTTAHLRSTLGLSLPRLSDNTPWSLGLTWVHETVDGQGSNGVLLSAGYAKF